MKVRVGRLLLTRHKVVSAEGSDAYLAFSVAHVTGEPSAHPPEIAEVREVPVAEAVRVTWISELSRLTIRLASARVNGWHRSEWKGGEVPGLASEASHPEIR